MRENDYPPTMLLRDVQLWESARLGMLRAMPAFDEWYAIIAHRRTTAAFRLLSKARRLAKAGDARLSARCTVLAEKIVADVPDGWADFPDRRRFIGDQLA